MDSALSPAALLLVGPALTALLYPTFCGRCGDLPLVEADSCVGLRRWVDGAGKLFFLSIASTVRSKRRKRDSARVRRGTSSMVFESSLTFRLISWTVAVS